MTLRQKIDKLKNFVYELYPDAKTELEYENEFQLLIAIIMSAQTTDKQVNKVNSEFFKVLKSPSDGVKLGEQKIREFIKTISFFNNKARNIFLTCEILSKNSIENFDSLEKLTTLPGVGIKTAKVFLAVTKDASHLAVDTHVHRVLNRVGIVKTNSPLQTNKEAEKVLTTNDLSKLHHSLIMFGRYFCTARKPNCPECKLKDICNYYKEKIKKQ